MTSKNVLSTLLLLTLLILAAGAGIAQATGSSTPGVYLLVEVNGESLPSVVWTKTSERQHCEIEDLRGAILLDSEGRWIAIGTERETCTDGSGTRTVGEERSDVVIGSYKISGSHITLHDETVGLGDDEGSLTNGVLVITSEGILDFEGQTTEWVLQKVD